MSFGILKMGFWFFLSAVIVSNMVFKAYKMRFIESRNAPDHRRLGELEREIKSLKEALANRDQRLSQLEEAVFFGDFDLKRQLNELEKKQTT